MDLNKIEKPIHIIYQFNEDKMPRCINCNLICCLNLKYFEGKPIINYHCENEHKGEILLKDYLIDCSKYSITKEICSECKKTQKKNDSNFFYCTKCSKFYCNFCGLNHQSSEEHFIANINKFNNLCKIHSFLYDSYCISCKKNICVFCQSEHKNHNLICLCDFELSNNQKYKIEKEIYDFELKIQNLEEIKKKIIEEIDKIIDSNKLELKYFKFLYSSYEYEYNQRNLNYYLIQNLKEIKGFESSKKNFYQEINKQCNNFILSLQKLQDIKTNYTINNFSNNFLTLSNKNLIANLEVLKDGRLVSFSIENSFKIYKKDSFEVQLSITLHTGNILYLTQLKNEKIITCSEDKTMKVIKLIDQDKYQIEQILEGHSLWIYKVIEIKENELISISFDKTMKIWKLNYDNKFICIQTIIFQNSNSYCNILKLNENEFVTSSCTDRSLKFWNLNNFSEIITINNIEIEWTLKTMILLEKDILCVGGRNSKGFYIIKISNHQIIKNIFGPKIIYSIVECLDDSILCSIININGNHSLVKYKYQNENLIQFVENENAHESYIYSCVELNNGIIASGGYDGLIKLWKE